MGKIDFDKLTYPNGEGYSPTITYGRSKLANLLFTYELQRYFEQIGADAKALAAHPGGSNTNLGNHLEGEWYFKLLGPFFEKMAQSAAMGALPTIRAAVDPNAHGGEYFGPEGFMEITGYPVVVQSNQDSHNIADARKLWQVSEELTGVRFG
jgi:NAD(P)-dependent dehydrogenase (short-subunit alcohol dehydrogenase family)